VGQFVPLGVGRTVSEVAQELACDWPTVNVAVTTYGEALLEADHKRLNRTRAIGLGETSFVRFSRRRQNYATTAAPRTSSGASHVCGASSVYCTGSSA
jgi:hypothetical protein